jgi:hypothetical protein
LKTIYILISLGVWTGRREEGGGRREEGGERREEGGGRRREEGGGKGDLLYLESGHLNMELDIWVPKYNLALEYQGTPSLPLLPASPSFPSCFLLLILLPYPSYSFLLLTPPYSSLLLLTPPSSS